MKKHKYFCLSCLLIVASLTSFVNQPNVKTIICYGVVKHDNEKTSGVSIQIFCNDNLLDEIVTDRGGGYGFTLVPGKLYKIEVNKEGYLKEEILINTHLPDEVITMGDVPAWEPEIYIYPIMSGLEYEEFNRPIASYVFNEELWQFAEDEKYKSSVEPILSKTLNKIAILKQEVYRKHISRADSLLSEQNYEEALLAYSYAQRYNSDEKYATSQIKSTKKLLKKAFSEEESYQQAIDKGNKYFADGNLEMANNFYQKALIYKPKELYPLDKLYEIDSIKSYEWIFKNRKYSLNVRSADSLYNNKEYTDAEKLYLKALDLFPKKDYPQKKLDEIVEINQAEAIKEKELAEQINLKTDSLNEEKKSATKISDDLKSIKLTSDKQVSELSTHQEKQEKILFEKDTATTKKSLLTAEQEVTKNITNDEHHAKSSELIEIQDNDNIKVEDDKKLEKEEPDIKETIRKLEDELKKKNITGDKKGSAEILSEIGMLYQSEFNLSKALDSYTKSLELNRNLKDKKAEAITLGKIATVMYDSGSYKSAINIFEESLELSEKLNDKTQSSEILDNIATVYENTYRYDEALEYLNKSVEIKQDLADKTGLSSAYKNMGHIYYEQNRFDKAIEKLEKSLEIDKEQDNKEEMASSLNNLGAAYYGLKQYDKAVEYYEQSLKLTEKTDNQRDKSITLNNIGNINFDFKKITLAIKYYEQSLSIKNNISFKEGIATTLHNIGNAYFELKDYAKAEEYFKASQNAAEEANFKEVIWRNYKAFAKTYSAMGRYRDAYINYKSYTDLKYEIDQQTLQLVEMREQYESSKIAVKSLQRELQKQNRIAKYEAERYRREMQIKDLEVQNKQQQLKKQRIIIVSFILGIVIVLIFSLIVYWQFQAKRKAYNIIAQQKEHITDGIAYAAKIQKAVLPLEKQVQNLLPEHFILYRPCQTVGGDFYWVSKYHQKTLIAVADCTGHGVPGGFMSMLGIALLNEILTSGKALETNVILSKLRDRVIDALHQKSGYTESLDGMDISLIIYDQKNGEVQFSGAYHSIYLVRNNQMETVKGNRLPIGYHFKKRDFTSQIIKLQPNDQIYMTTDGFLDQIGQKTNQRLMMSKFKEEIMSVHAKPMSEQQQHMEKVLNSWQGNLAQTDDILVMGLRF